MTITIAQNKLQKTKTSLNILILSIFIISLSL